MAAGEALLRELGCDQAPRAALPACSGLVIDPKFVRKPPDIEAATASA